MAFDQSTRGRLQKLVNSCRGLLSDEFSIQLQQTYGLDPKTGEITPMERLNHLDDRQRHTAEVLRQTLAHYLGADADDTDHRITVLDRMVREQAFTVLNRLAALLMMEARGQLIESVSKSYQSRGYQLYSKIAGTALGETGQAYQVYLFSVFDELAQELPALFDRYAANGLLFPRETALRALLDELNHFEIEPLWGADETIGWIYQYFNSKEERKAMRDASQAPRNSRELAVRNQFFTPRYVVEFLVDNTLGRLWYDATGGQTELRHRCQYLLVKPDEKPQASSKLRDPRTLKLLDPACGSMHFGLYAFDLFLEIYREAWVWEQHNGPGSLDVSMPRQTGLRPLSQTYSDQVEFLADVPRLIIEHNIYGVDIDPRAAQIATLALWLRAQRAWHDAEVKANARPRIGQGHVVAAVAPPAERKLRLRFVAQLDQRDAELFEKTLHMLKNLPELGVLLRVEQDLPILIRQTFVGKGIGLFAQQEQESWTGAEARLRQSLLDFYSAAGATYQGRLFAQDALQGLRLIDIVTENFDVLLMNPPFGLPAVNAKEIIKKAYPDSWTDYYNAFIKRATELVCDTGFFGAVVPNRLLYTKKSSAIRDLLSSNWSLKTLVDAGRDVMDDAAVDALFFTAGLTDVDNQINCPILDLRSTDVLTRPATLLSWSKNPTEAVDFSHFKAIPGNTFSYSAPIDYLKLWKNRFKLDPDLATVATGGKTFDDTRFLRLRWEVAMDKLGDKWISVDTGGDYQMWYSPSVFVQNWEGNGAEVRAFAIKKHSTDAQVMQSSKHWFKPGLSYPYTSSIGFGPRVLPKNTIFSSDSIAIHPLDGNDAIPLLGLLASNWTSELLNCFGGGRKTENSLVKSLPVQINESSRDVLNNVGFKAIADVIEAESKNETSPLFQSPLSGSPLDELDARLRCAINDVDAVSKAAYGIFDEKKAVANNQKLVESYIKQGDDYSKASSEISYLIGVAFNRWNIKFATGEIEFLTHENVFQELPKMPPGALPCDGLTKNQEIFCIDGGSHCLVEKLRDGLRTLYGDASEAREIWLCSSVGYHSVSEYLSSSTGFFADHLKKYSRSGRRAPIYWPLSTACGNYTLWVYYPILNNQTLFTAVNDFLDGPNGKLTQVNRECSELRVKGIARSRDEEKRYEMLHTFEQELTDLRDTLLKIAPTYQPNHDDGVQITAAPLWPLFRHKPWQKVLKDTWAKLEKGDYDWAHLAMAYYPDRVREKCKTDKSLAIAHGLEDLYLEPQAAPKKTRTKKIAGADE